MEKERLEAMSKEELVAKAMELQEEVSKYKISWQYQTEKVDRLSEILSAIGIAYETYKRERV